MSFLVQINDNAGDADPEPILLRLYPGEERSFELRVVNLGDPTSIIVEVSEELKDLIVPAKDNQYVVLEKTVVFTAVAPQDDDLMTGEIVLRSSSGPVRIPVTLISEEPENAEDQEDEPYEESPNEEEERPVSQRMRIKEMYGGGEEGMARPPARAAVDIHDAVEQEEFYDPLRTLNSPEQVAFERKIRGRPTTQDYREEEIPASPPREQKMQRLKQDEVMMKDGDDFADFGTGEEASTDYVYGDLPFDVQKRRVPFVPAALLMALIALLVLTFYTETLPEFYGALASSMLIVTLIIYGAASVLKA